MTDTESPGATTTPRQVWMPGFNHRQHLCANPNPPYYAFTNPAFSVCGQRLVDYPADDPRLPWQSWPCCAACRKQAPQTLGSLG